MNNKTKSEVVKCDAATGLFIASDRHWLMAEIDGFHKFAIASPGIDPVRRHELASVVGAVAYQRLTAMGGLLAAW